MVGMMLLVVFIGMTVPLLVISLLRSRRRMGDLEERKRERLSQAAISGKAVPSPRLPEAGTEVWPFDQSRKAGCLTLQSIINGQQPILQAIHDAEIHDWQFLGLGDVEPGESSVVSMQEIVDIDKSVFAIADLPPGWRAWRESQDQPWQKEPSEEQNDETAQDRH